MSEYKGIKGFQVQTRTEDPSPTEAQTGDFYYNSTTGQFKTVNTGGAPIGTWASGGVVNNGRHGCAGFGTQTAAAGAGGYEPSGAYSNKTEEYNGTSWTEVNDFPTGADSVGSAGSQTAGLIFGGQRPPNTNATFEYDGTNWTTGGDLNLVRRDLIGAGSQTAALAALGAIDPPFTGDSEQYNGTAWTEVADANTGRRSAGGAGTYTSALAYGGYIGPPTEYTANVESWDGTSWTEVANISSIRGAIGCGGSSNSDSLAYGGYGGPPGSTLYALTEVWNGTSWTELNDMASTRSSKFGFQVLVLLHFKWLLLVIWALVMLTLQLQKNGQQQISKLKR